MARAVSQPLLLNATGLPEGARYFGFVILGRPPTTVEPAPTVPSNRAVVYVADLIGEPRMFGGRRWSPIINSPAEVLELIDAANGQLVTVVRAPPSLTDPYYARSEILCYRIGEEGREKTTAGDANFGVHESLDLKTERGRAGLRPTGLSPGRPAASRTTR